MLEHMTLTNAERDYLAGQALGRLATVRADGGPQNSPVGFRYDQATGTVDIRGRTLAATQKFRNVAATGVASLVIDDLPSRDPWTARGVEIRGRAEALTDPEVIRIHPRRVVSWGVDPASPGMTARDVQPTSNS